MHQQSKLSGHRFLNLFKKQLYPPTHQGLAALILGLQRFVPLILLGLVDFLFSLLLLLSFEAIGLSLGLLFFSVG